MKLSLIDSMSITCNLPIRMANFHPINQGTNECKIKRKCMTLHRINSCNFLANEIFKINHFIELFSIWNKNEISICKVINILERKAEESEKSDNGFFFCSFLAEQVELHNIPRNKHVYPEYSFKLAMACKIHIKSPGLCKKNRKNFSFILLPDSRVLFRENQRKLLLPSSATRINSSTHLGIIQSLSQNILTHQNRYAIMRIDEVNIKLSHQFSNKNMFLRIAHNDT